MKRLAFWGVFASLLFLLFLSPFLDSPSEMFPIFFIVIPGILLGLLVYMFMDRHKDYKQKKEAKEQANQALDIQESSLSAQQKTFFDLSYEEQKKTKAITYLWLIFLGGIGAHHYYLGNKDKMPPYVIHVVAVLLSFGFIAPVTVTIMIVVLFCELFMVPGYVRTANKRVEQKILTQCLMTSQPQQQGLPVA